MDNCEHQRTDPPLPFSSTTRELRNKGSRKEFRVPRRRWEVFPGKNRFLCDGRVIMARHTGALPLTLSLIIVTSGLFFAFDSPFLVKHLTSGVPVIGGVLFVFVVTTLLRTSFSDPGILPRATPDEAADTEEKIDNTDTDISENGNYRPPPRIKDVVINQQVVKLKYCFTCRMFRPPRTSHCSLCDNCVERFDHHCPWVGNCVGRRNYRFFYSFIVSLSFLTTFIFSCVMTHIALKARDGKGLVFVLKDNPGSAVELMICFLAIWSILGLSGFHTFLVASNRTTNEDVKGTWSAKNGADDTTNPYSHHNILVNCCSVLCGPMPPSLINRRGLLHPDDVFQRCRSDIQATINQESLDLLESLTSLTCPQGIAQSAHSSPANTNSSPEGPTYCKDQKPTSLITQSTTSPFQSHDTKSSGASLVFCSSSNMPASLTSLDASSVSVSS